MNLDLDSENILSEKSRNDDEHCLRFWSPHLCVSRGEVRHEFMVRCSFTGFRSFVHQGWHSLCQRSPHWMVWFCSAWWRGTCRARTSWSRWRWATGSSTSRAHSASFRCTYKALVAGWCCLTHDISGRSPHSFDSSDSSLIQIYKHKSMHQNFSPPNRFFPRPKLCL